MEGDSGGRLLLAEEGWGLHLGVAEPQVFVKVVEAVDEVTHMTSQHLQVKSNRSHAFVLCLCNKTNKWGQVEVKRVIHVSHYYYMQYTVF